MAYMMETEEQQSFDQLIEMLNDPDPETRGLVAVGLGRLRDIAAVGPLVGLLSDNDERVRIAAVHSLGEVGSTTAVEPLLTLLQEESGGVRSAVIVALAQLPDARAFAPIVTRLFDADDEVRRNAAAAIGKLGDLRALEPLIECLRDPYYWVRANAAWSLGQLQARNAVPALINAFFLEDDEAVCSNILVALGHIGTQEAIAHVIDALTDEEQSPKDRIAAALAFAAYCEADSETDLDDLLLQTARTTLIALLHSEPDDELRSTAAWTLGRLPHDDVTISALIQALEDPYEWVISYAVESLALLGDRRAIEPIRACIECGGEKSFVDMCNRALTILEKGHDAMPEDESSK